MTEFSNPASSSTRSRSIALERGRCPVCPVGTATRLLGSAPDFEYDTTPGLEWNVVECVRCRTSLLDPCPADAEIASLYPPEYEPYRFDTMSALVRTARDCVQRRKVSRVRSLVGSDATIVDIGRGNGALLELFRRYGQPGWILVGWDFPGPHLDRLEQRGIPVIAAPISKEYVGELTADVVVLNQVVEHFREPSKLIRLCEQILKQGGHLVVETPNCFGIDARLSNPVIGAAITFRGT